MAKRDLVIRVAGEAGEGVLSTGQFIAQAAARAGYGVLTDFVPPSEIKGGHSFFQIRLSDRRLYSRGDALDVLLAFNQEAYDKNIQELSQDGLLIYDSAEFTPPEGGARRTYALPLTNIAKTELQFELGKNVVAVGAVAALFGLPVEFLTRLVHERFGRKGEDILGKNLRALELGREYIERTIPDRESLYIAVGKRDEQVIVTSGNQAIALGALVAGCRLYAGYPITPATDIMEFLAAELPKVGGSIVQAEDEISAIGIVLGGSYAGTKSMTATSGPGVSLMTEMLGLASMAEIPCVVVDCQRAGPSTGMPTRHEQGDLNLAVHGAHGEVQRIVLAPTSVADCFWQMINAFNLSERYQMPVVVLSDTVLAVRTESIPRPDLSKVEVWDRVTYRNGRDGLKEMDRYLRYRLTDDGVSPMSIPGTEGGQYVATGLEHNEVGRHRADAKTHSDQTRKRFRKLDLALRDAPPPHRAGDPGAEIGILTWGSTYGVALEAAGFAAAEGIKVDVLAPRMLWPLPDEQLRPFVEQKRVVLVPEVNFTGQFAEFLAARYKRDFQRVNIYGGQPFQVRDIVQAIQGVMQHAR
jgi:2-oxoglutarate ferredoxin oxidoreductase subunit alpha